LAQAVRAVRSRAEFTQHGISLIELLVFIVVVGIAVAGLLTVYSTSTRASADPVVRKQVQAIAESLLEEVLAKPFTYCDPDDPNTETATSAADCATPEASGPEAGESRYAATRPFDNVNDYDSFAMTGIADLAGDVVAGLDAYSATVSVAPAGIFNGIPAGETLLVTVTVTGPGNHSLSLSGYRTRHAPNL
jgi:MSHA pilin protein MshD